METNQRTSLLREAEEEEAEVAMETNKRTSLLREAEEGEAGRKITDRKKLCSHKTKF